MIDFGAAPIPGQLTLAVGDLLRLSASGGQIVEGGECLQLIGPLTSAAVGLDGSIVTPAALPNVVLVMAMSPGTATMQIHVGRDFRPTSPITIKVNITASP